MTKLSPIAQALTTKAWRLSKPLSTVVAACALSLFFAAASQASLITGDPQPDNPLTTWKDGAVISPTAPSTNALNAASQAPGHVGQNNPYVLLNLSTLGQVTLDFFNLAPGLAFFETRIDDIATGTTAHPVVIGDFIHTGGTAVATGTSLIGKTFTASNYVDIRLALGGERDWDFDWVRFNVQQANAVPSPGTLPLLGLGLIGLAALRRRS